MKQRQEIPDPKKEHLFDAWPEKYERWFATPIGRAVLKYEKRLIAAMLPPLPGQQIFDAGCGTGIFTEDYLESGTAAIGLDLSLTMIQWAMRKLRRMPFRVVQGDLRHLPFRDGAFDHACSITALEFIDDAENAVQELSRVVKPGGTVLVATLNEWSSWAAGRREKVGQGKDTIFRQAIFRSPDDLRSLPIPPTARIRTAVHFHRNDPLESIPDIEEEGERRDAMTGAFIACSWRRT